MTILIRFNQEAKKKRMVKSNQTNVRLDKTRLERLDKAVERYKKGDRQTIFRELFDWFMDDYEAAEEARLEILLMKKAERKPDDIADGKHPAEAVKRKSASQRGKAD